MSVDAERLEEAQSRESAFAGIIGAGKAVMEMAAEDLERGEESARVAAMLRRYVEELERRFQVANAGPGEETNR